MPRYRICKSFVVESGHMLSKHPEACRYPHGHSRRIDVVVSSEELNENDMVLDFKALKNAISQYIDRLDHSMAINSLDPLLEDIRKVHPDSLVIFENVDPTTEILAKDLYHFVEGVLARGIEHGTYRIKPQSVRLERIRVGETATSWAEYGD